VTPSIAEAQAVCCEGKKVKRAMPWFRYFGISRKKMIDGSPRDKVARPIAIDVARGRGGGEARLRASLDGDNM
jgi:hypothetical protein